MAAGTDPRTDETWNFRTLLSQRTAVNVACRLASANVALPKKIPAP